MALTKQRQRGRRTARECLIDTASRLFYERGFQAVGVDEIVAESGVGKMTLYRHFPSKDDLIVAYLTRSENAFRKWLEGALASADNARDRLDAVFAKLGDLAQSEECLGCTFQVTAAEFPDSHHRAHRIAVSHKRAVRATFQKLASQGGFREPNVLADQLLMLMDGAWVAARMFGRKNPARSVRSAAQALMRAHLPPDPVA